MRFRQHVCQLKRLVSQRDEPRTRDYLVLMRNIMFGLLALALVTGTIGFVYSYFATATLMATDPPVVLVNAPPPPHRTLPKGFPVSFPVPNDSILEEAAAVNTPDSRGYRATWTFPDQTPSAVAEQFTADFGRLHWPYDAFDDGQGELTIQFTFPGSSSSSTLVLNVDQDSITTARLDLMLPPRR